LLSGAAALAVQNALLFAGFLVWFGDPDSGYWLGSSSLFIDILGTVMVGIGVLRLTGKASTRHDSHHALLSGILLVSWPFLTASWRWLVPSMEGWSYSEVFDALLDSDGGAPASLAHGVPAVWAMLVLWVAASISLLVAVLLLRLRGIPQIGKSLFGARLDMRSWEGYAMLNAAGTVLAAGGFMSILSGGAGNGLLTAGIALKVTLVPFNGMFAYSLLIYRALRSHRQTDEPERGSVPAPGGDT